MSVARPRRTQRERSDTTRAALVGAATELFAERGFHGTPAELVVRRAGVSSGALYHHFGDKRGLFRAAFEAVERGLADRVAASARAGTDPWQRLERGVAAYLRACGEPAVRRIVLLDGPSVLGWEEWRAADAAHHLRPLAAALAASMRAGLLDRRPPEPLARVLLGSLTEAGLAAVDDAAAHEAVAWILSRLRRA
ncbi:MAG TPA: helix-turn-helix domain-containing protein [Candidatus Dormibacteraeota bacterium]